MKITYTLTEFQGNVLKSIQNKLSCDISLLRERISKLDDCNDVIEIIDRIEVLSHDMEDILVSDGLISREIASIKWNKVNMRKKDKNLPPEEKYVCWAMLIDSEEDIHFRKFFGKLKDGYVDGGTFRYKLSSNFWWSELSNPEVTK